MQRGAISDGESLRKTLSYSRTGYTVRSAMTEKWSVETTMARKISEVFDREVQTDDESFDKRDRQLLRIWKDSNKEQRAIIDDVLITLCGWSFDTLRKMAREKEDK